MFEFIFGIDNDMPIDIMARFLKDIASYYKVDVFGKPYSFPCRSLLLSTTVLDTYKYTCTYG